MLRSYTPADLKDTSSFINTLLQQVVGNETFYHITVSIMPFIYKDRFINQYNITLRPIKSILKEILSLSPNIQHYATVAAEATKAGNIHYHIMLKCDIPLYILQDKFKGTPCIGNIKITIPIGKKDIQIVYKYLIKDWEHTMELLDHTKLTDKERPLTHCSYKEKVKKKNLLDFFDN
uniref:hypothetical protein n=1 Tax=Polynucleobacter sp. TaxID=2029855 RepID=UPI004047CA63